MVNALLTPDSRHKTREGNLFDFSNVTSSGSRTFRGYIPLYNRLRRSHYAVRSSENRWFGRGVPPTQGTSRVCYVRHESVSRDVPRT